MRVTAEKELLQRYCEGCGVVVEGDDRNCERCQYVYYGGYWRVGVLMPTHTETANALRRMMR